MLWRIRGPSKQLASGVPQQRTCQGLTPANACNPNRFVTRSEECRLPEILGQHFDMRDIDESLGGSRAAGFDADKYAARLQAEEARRCAAVAAAAAGMKGVNGCTLSSAKGSETVVGGEVYLNGFHGKA